MNVYDGMLTLQVSVLQRRQRPMHIYVIAKLKYKISSRFDEELLLVIVSCSRSKSSSWLLVQSHRLHPPLHHRLVLVFQIAERR